MNPFFITKKMKKKIADLHRQTNEFRKTILTKHYN